MAEWKAMVFGILFPLAILGLLAAAIVLRFRSQSRWSIATILAALSVGIVWWMSSDPEPPETRSGIRAGRHTGRRHFRRLFAMPPRSVRFVASHLSPHDDARCHARERQGRLQRRRLRMRGNSNSAHAFRRRILHGDHRPGCGAARLRGGPGSPRTIRLRIDRTVGSHWIQEYFHRLPNGRFVRLPVLYHIVEKRWIRSNGAFLSPDTPDFWAQSRGLPWNETCLYCHNTEPVKNPIRGQFGQVVGYDTESDGIRHRVCRVSRPRSRARAQPTQPKWFRGTNRRGSSGASLGAAAR